MNISEALICEIVTKVLEESAGKGSKLKFEKHIDPSGVIGIKASIVKCEPLRQGGIKFKDAMTLEGAPHMGCGIIELDHISFEWTLTYGGYDLVLDGTLGIETDDHVVSEGPGNIIYIPEGSRIHFQTPNRTRCAYLVYPADWQ